MRPVHCTSRIAAGPASTQQPIDFKLTAYWNMEHPANAPHWSLQLQVLSRHSKHESSRLKGV